MNRIKRFNEDWDPKTLSTSNGGAVDLLSEVKDIFTSLFKDDLGADEVHPKKLTGSSQLDFAPTESGLHYTICDNKFLGIHPEFVMVMIRHNLKSFAEGSMESTPSAAESRKKVQEVSIETLAYIKETIIPRIEQSLGKRVKYRMSSARISYSITMWIVDEKDAHLLPHTLVDE